MLEQITPELPQTDPQTEQKFNWRNCWYPITFVVDFPAKQPYSFSIYGEAFVLFRDANEELICLEDRCPHRAAKLSDGQILEGKIECLYHGWQFGQDGACLHIPQLQETAQIPARACAKSFPVVEHQKVIWVWTGETEKCDRATLPTIADIDRPDVFVVDTVTDLPFDQTFLIENLLDPAHVYISHDRTELGIRREDAQPLDIKVSPSSMQGFQGKINRDSRPFELNFNAPHFVHYNFSKPEFGMFGGFLFFCLPLAYGKSRILERRYGNFYKPPFTLKPRWLEHLRQNKILEEDLPFIVEQQRYLEQSQRSLKEVYFPLKTIDVLVMEYRRWLDRFGVDLPWYQGYETAVHPEAIAEPEIPSRLVRHTQQCSSCSQTYQRIEQIQKIARGKAIVFLALALLTQGNWQLFFTISFILAAATIAGMKRLQGHFERTFTRI